MLIVMIAAAPIGCARDPSPVAPTAPVAANVVVPPPAPRDVTLSGRVTEAPPTTTTGVWDAIVTLDNGIDSWQSSKTIGGVGRGAYTIAGLHAGRYRAIVSAEGFVSVSRDVSIESDATADFQLLPIAVTKSITLSDHLGDHDGTCSDGTALKPCHIVAVPVHNPGPIDATLTWHGASGGGLILVLFTSGEPAPLMQSTSVDAAHEHIAATVAGGAVYEMRVIFAAGAGTAMYSLSVAYPN